MSIPNEALQKLAIEIESQAATAQRDINLVKAAIVTKQRDIRKLEITSKEVKSLDRDTKVYEGVGKMFVFSPTENVNDRLEKDVTELRSDVTNLNKKLHYLETTYKNSREHIDKIISSGGKK